MRRNNFTRFGVHQYIIAIMTNDCNVCFYQFIPHGIEMKPFLSIHLIGIIIKESTYSFCCQLSGFISFENSPFNESIKSVLEYIWSISSKVYFVQNTFKTRVRSISPNNCTRLLLTKRHTDKHRMQHEGI